MSWLNEATELKTAEEKQFEYEKSVQHRLTSAVQRHMDAVVGERNYDSIISCCTYATSLNPKFSAEGQAAVEWRDDVWVVCYDILDEVKTGQRPIPTEDELIALLPVLEWPAT